MDKYSDFKGEMNKIEYINFCEKFEEFTTIMENYRNYQKVINDIFDNKKYIIFVIVPNFKNKEVSINKLKELEEIPYFNPIEIYLPFIKNGTLEDYINKYEELNTLSILSKSESVVSIDLNKSIENFKEKINKKSKNIKELNCNINEKNIKEIFKQNYYKIYNFLESKNRIQDEEYKILESLNMVKQEETRYVLLQVDFKNKKYYLDEKGYFNPHCKNLFCIHKKEFKNIEDIYPFSFLYYEDYSITRKIIEVDKTIEFIDNSNNIENF